MHLRLPSLPSVARQPVLAGRPGDQPHHPNSMQEVIRHLRRTVLVRDGAALTDAQLLTLFIDRRDEAAFEALVRRHGPMVMGVCRRILRCPHDAEDAFQATFLVLVRKATTVVPREMVANWLHGVARTTALRANAVTAKRQMRERQVREMPEPEAVQPHRGVPANPPRRASLGRFQGRDGQGRPQAATPASPV